jgi:stress response protein YsnF
MAKTVVGFFDTYAQAQRAVEDLVRNGFARDDINIITNKERYSEAGHDDATGAAVGATTGAVLGGAAGLVAAMIPGVGPVLAAGPLIAALVGAGAGAVAGGIIGALVDAGVPEEDAKLYEEGIRRGGTLLMVKAENNMASRAAQIMNQAGAIDIRQRGTEWRSGARHMSGAQAQQGQQQKKQQPGQRATQREGEIRVPVVEEELKVGKREVSGEAGGRGVRVATQVHEKPVEKQVQLHEEHVSVERRPTNRPASAADLSGQKGETFEVRERREEPVVQKTARVVEEVVVNKEERDRTETVRDTVRRKDVEVQPIGGHRGEDDSDFRNNFKTAYANTGMSYEQCAPAYQYGSQLNQRYAGRDWNAIEPEVRRDWESRNPNTWDRMKNAVRYGWDRMKQKVS